MWIWLKKLFGGKKSASQIKSFDDALADSPIREYRKTGQQSIATDKIVGSVGRAHELDENFRYRDRVDSSRHFRVQDAMREGRPTQPIKVIKLKRERSASEYYVMDGHHRVSQAKRQGLSEMNAEITEAVLDDDATE